MVATWSPSDDRVRANTSAECPAYLNMPQRFTSPFKSLSEVDTPAYWVIDTRTSWQKTKEYHGVEGLQIVTGRQGRERRYRIIQAGQRGQKQHRNVAARRHG